MSHEAGRLAKLFEDGRRHILFNPLKCRLYKDYVDKKHNSAISLHARFSSILHDKKTEDNGASHQTFEV